MKVAIYCRLSDEDRGKQSDHDDSVSIQNQKSMLIKHAIDSGWHIYKIYSDDDYSGADRNRPEFNCMIQDAEDRKFDIVLCKTQSRFTRELELVEKYIHTLFPAWGIRFVSLVDNADTDDKGNKKSRQINALINEWYLEEISDNIKSVLTNRREQGYHIGSFAPYGYQKNPKQKGHLLIDPEAAAVVREIFNLYIQGNGKQAIARILNEKGIPNPTEYKRLHGQIRNNSRKNSGLWTYFTISNILTNEVYIGHMIQGKSGVASYKTQEKVTYPEDQWIIAKNTHDPIIHETTWNKVQAMIAAKAPDNSYGREEGIFARKVRCISCGYRMHSVKNRTKRGFKCDHHTLSRNSCVGGYISLRRLERIILAQLCVISNELLDDEMLEKGIDPFGDIELINNALNNKISQLERKIESNQIRMKKLYLQKLRQQISQSDYFESVRNISAEKADIDNRISEYKSQLAKVRSTIDGAEDKKAMIAQYKGCRKLTKEMVTELIDYIEVGKKDPVTKCTPVIIHWNF